MWSGETQRPALPRHQGEEIKIFHISFTRVRIEPTTYHAYIHILLISKLLFINSRKF